MVEINHAIRKNGEVPEDIKLKALRKLFIGGLATQTNRDDLVEHFSRFGTVANAYVIYDPLTRQSKNFGYVEFKNASSAKAASGCKDHMVNGKKATLQFFKAKEGHSKRTHDVADNVEHMEENQNSEGVFETPYMPYDKVHKSSTSYGMQNDFGDNYYEHYGNQYQGMPHLLHRESIIPSGSQPLHSYSREALEIKSRPQEFYMAFKKNGGADMSRSHQWTNIRFNHPLKSMHA